MSQATHTKWQLGMKKICGGWHKRELLAGDQLVAHIFCEEGDEEKAEYIVRACNAHENESDIESPNRTTTEGDLLRAALASAKGEKP
jgi:hypothetical protein